MLPARVRKGLAWGTALAVGAAVVLHVRGEGDVFARLLAVSPGAVALMVLAWLLLSIPRGLIRKVMVAQLGTRLRFVDWYGLSMVTNLLGLVTPARGDAILAGAYLKRRYSLPVSRFLGTVYANAVLLAIVLSVEGLIALLAIERSQGLSSPVVWIAVAVPGLAAGLLGIGSPGMVRWRGWLGDRLRAALGGWEAIRQNSRALAASGLLTFLGTVCFTFWTWTAFRALHLDVGFAALVLTSVVGQLAAYVNLTPGNLGIREALLGFTTGALGIGFAEGVAVTLLQRAVSTVLFLVVGGAFGAIALKGALRAPEESEG
jgi:uncharacterized membrane protein YbhN (UPF0104 family)